MQTLYNVFSHSIRFPNITHLNSRDKGPLNTLFWRLVSGLCIVEKRSLVLNFPYKVLQKWLKNFWIPIRYYDSIKPMQTNYSLKEDIFSMTCNINLVTCNKMG